MFISEIVSVFEDSQLNPLFRHHIPNFSINQVATDRPDEPADFTTVSTRRVQEFQAVLESLVVDRLCESPSP